MTTTGKVFAGSAVFVLLSVIAVVWVIQSLNRFQVNGTLEVAGLRAPVEVFRDEQGVPYIFADNQQDLFFAQGFVTAQHRLFQIELYRHLIEGRLSELIGRDGYSSDVAMRVLDLRRNARQHAARLNRQTRDRLVAYTRGYTAYVRQYPHEHHLELRLLGIEPTPMSVEDAMAILHFIAYSQSQNYPAELLFQRVIDAVGEEHAARVLPLLPSGDRRMPVSLEADASALLLPDELVPGSIAVGSNSWAVAPQRSSGGKAILANDPHLDARVLPGIWHPVGLHAPGIEAVGVSIPGLPGLVVGRNRYVAFGVTNGYADVQDVYIETLDPDDPDRYMENGVSRPFRQREEVIRIKDSNAERGYGEERLMVRSTSRGPVISDHALGRDESRVLTARWSAAEEAGWEPSIGIDKLMLAESVEEVDSAAQAMSILAFNVVFAGADGDIGFRATGRVPVRADGQGQRPRLVGGSDDWVGWIPAAAMPGELRPERGWVATANNDTRGENYPYYYSTFFAPPYRYRRVEQLVGGTYSAGAEEHWAWMQDIRNLQAEGLRPLFLDAMDRMLQADAGEIPALETARDLLARWDLEDNADSAAPLIYQALYREFAFRVFAGALGPELALQLLRSPYHWQARLDGLAQNGELPAWLRTEDAESVDHLLEETVLATLQALGERFGPDPEDWHWGKAHTIIFHSPLRPSGVGRDWLGGGQYPYSGSGETLRRGAYSFASPWEIRLHDSLRLVADFSDDEKIMAVLAGGVVGRQFHAHFRDQLSTWLSGDPRYWWLDPDAVREHAVDHATMIPRRANR